MERPSLTVPRLQTVAPEYGAAERPAAIPVVGIPLALTNYQQTMDWMDATIARRERAIVTAAAVHLVMVAREDPATREAICRDDVLAVPDGQPLAWALRALGHDRASRVYGPDLMAKYCQRSAHTGVRMYLYGGRHPGALLQLTLPPRRRHSRPKNVGGHSPPLPQ